MKIYNFSNNVSANLDQITSVEKNDEKGIATLHMSDGNKLQVPLSEFNYAVKLEIEKMEKTITRTDIRNLIDTMNRLANSIPHSVRMHF